MSIELYARIIPAKFEWEGQIVHLHIFKDRRRDGRDFWDIRYRFSLALNLQPRIKSLQTQGWTLEEALKKMVVLLKERGLKIND